MNRVAFILLFLFLLMLSCCTAPGNFSYRYIPEDTGLKNRIDIEGCYISMHGCDTSFYSVYMFYPDGLFTIATASNISQDLVNCFAQGGSSNICKYPLWGIYRLYGDTIKTQVIRPEGSKCVIFRDYLILPDKSVVNISDYVEPEYTNLGYMQNYPSFYDNPCALKARFLPVESKRPGSDCPFINKGWFRK